MIKAIKVDENGQIVPTEEVVDENELNDGTVVDDSDSDIADNDDTATNDAPPMS